MQNIPWFPCEDVLGFPNVESALCEPDGLLAMGGNLSEKTLLKAYESGIFPWFDDEREIMWWSPMERAIIPSRSVHVSKNMAKLLRQQRYQVVVDTQFSAVMLACGQREQTWITNEMRDAYLSLYEAGIAHSIEVLDTDGILVGGLYGVFVRNCFCGESMFSNVSDASKLALIALARFLQQNKCQLIDCQMQTPHLARMGAVVIPRSEFVAQLHEMNDNECLANIQWSSLWEVY